MDGLLQRFPWNKVGRAIQPDRGSRSKRHRRGRIAFGYANAYLGISRSSFQVDCGMAIRILGRPNQLDRIPALAESSGLEGMQPRKVRLIVGIDAGHELKIRGSRISQLLVPSLTELATAPGPELL